MFTPTHSGIYCGSIQQHGKWIAGEMGPIMVAGEIGPITIAGEIGPIMIAGEIGPIMRCDFDKTYLIWCISLHYTSVL